METARAVAQRLAGIHAWSAARPDSPPNSVDALFFALRLEPHLLVTARRHPDLAGALEALVARTQRHPRRSGAWRRGQEHHRRAAGPVAARRRVRAWWGDPAFDIAFCLNHLLLKCLWNPAAADALLAATTT